MLAAAKLQLKRETMAAVIQRFFHVSWLLHQTAIHVLTASCFMLHAACACCVSIHSEMLGATRPCASVWREISRRHVSTWRTAARAKCSASSVEGESWRCYSMCDCDISNLFIHLLFCAKIRAQDCSGHPCGHRQTNLGVEILHHNPTSFPWHAGGVSSS